MEALLGIEDELALERYDKRNTKRYPLEGRERGIIARMFQKENEPIHDEAFTCAGQYGSSSQDKRIFTCVVAEY
jgi:hypothetical protein